MLVCLCVCVCVLIYVCYYELQSILYNVQERCRILVRVVANTTFDQVRALAQQTLETAALQNCRTANADDDPSSSSRIITSQHITSHSIRKHNDDRDRVATHTTNTATNHTRTHTHTQILDAQHDLQGKARQRKKRKKKVLH